MVAILFAISGIAAVAGVGAILVGFPNYEFGLGNTLILSGVVAIVGALIVFGLAATVRELRRVGRLLERPARQPRPVDAEATCGRHEPARRCDHNRCRRGVVLPNSDSARFRPRTGRRWISIPCVPVACPAGGKRVSRLWSTRWKPCRFASGTGALRSNSAATEPADGNPVRAPRRAAARTEHPPSAIGPPARADAANPQYF